MKKLLAILLIITLVLSAAGCAVSSTENTGSTSENFGTADQAAPEETLAGPATIENQDSKAMGGSESVADPTAVYDKTTASDARMPGNGFVLSPDQKIIFNCNLTLETEKFNESLNKIDLKVKETGSYIESSGISGTGKTEYDLRYASFVIRVPAAKFDDMKKAAEDWGSVISSNTSSQDVTKQYIDTEARVKTLKLQEERLLMLLGKAEKLEDIIVLEGRLSEIRLQIESYTGSLQELDALVDYATITVAIQEVQSETFVPQNFGQRLLETIRESFGKLSQYAEKTLFVLIYLMPYALLAMVLVLIFRKMKLGGRWIKRKGNEEERSETLNKR
jgi:hypothetical protein